MFIAEVFQASVQQSNIHESWLVSCTEVREELGFELDSLVSLFMVVCNTIDAFQERLSHGQLVTPSLSVANALLISYVVTSQELVLILGSPGLWVPHSDLSVFYLDKSEPLPPSNTDIGICESQSATVCLLSLTFAHITPYPQALSLSSQDAVLQSCMSVLTVAIWHLLEEWLWVSVTNQPLGTGPRATDRWQLPAIKTHWQRERGRDRGGGTMNL